MCWSWEVSLTFSLLQWTCIAYMWRRNALLDRWLLPFLCVVATQETIQFVLWGFVLVDGHTNTPEQCSTLNRVLSYLLLFVVEAIPWIIPTIALKASTPSVMDEANRPRRYLFIVVLILTLTEYVVQIGAVIYYDVFGDDAMCSHVGDDQHMVWSYFDVEGQHLVFGLVTWPAYFLPIVMTFWFRPLWIVLPLIIYSLVSATSLNVYFNLSSAWAPMWCWANFVNALWFLTVPRIARKVKADLEEPESKWRWLFHGTDELKLRDRDQVEIDGTVTEAGNRML